MSATEFTLRMQRIGASEKLSGKVTKKGRPVIGRIGIGLLAVGHISQRFRIVSGRPQDDLGFEAKVDMSRLFGPGAESLPLEELAAGTVQMRMYKKPKGQQYTLVDIETVSDVFRNLLVDGFKNRYRGFDKEPGANFQDFVTFIQSKTKRISQLSGYDQMLWELGLLSPVPYLDDGPVRINSPIISSLKNRLQSYKFSLYVDRIEVRKPIRFPAPAEKLQEGKDYGVYPIKIKEEIEDGVIEAVGYLYHQNIRVIPSEQRGLLPRMKNVGIGLPYLNIFRILTESPIITWQVAGELYVDQGLDDALNIDRNSFFEASPSFQRLRESLERILREEKILVDIKRRQVERTRERRGRKSSSEVRILESVAAKAGVRTPRVKFVHEKRAIPLRFEAPNVITVFRSKLSKGESFIVEGVILCFELSKKSKGRETSFYKLLEAFLDEVLKSRAVRSL